MSSVSEAHITDIHSLSSYGEIESLKLAVKSHISSVVSTSHSSSPSSVLARSCSTSAAQPQSMYIDDATIASKARTFLDRTDTYGLTCLHEACRNGHSHIVEYLLEHKVSIDLVNSMGQTALHFAAGGGHLDCAKLLVQHNATIDIADRQKRTPLHWASMNGHDSVGKLLMLHGANPAKMDASGKPALLWTSAVRGLQQTFKPRDQVVEEKETNQDMHIFSMLEYSRQNHHASDDDDDGDDGDGDDRGGDEDLMSQTQTGSDDALMAMSSSYNQ
jgi:Ankyrin repeats (3 copies)/Ankyrin repeat